jgi:hypothetical protein
MDSVINLTFELARKGYQISFSKIYNESLITRARNNLVKEFLDSDADYLFFIDADEGFNVADVVAMIEIEADVIGGIYPMKNINWEGVRAAALAGKENLADYSGIFAMNLLPGTSTIKLNEPVEVTEVATGLMLIKRNVFEEMEPLCPKYALNGSNGQFDFDRMVTEFFATSIEPTGERLLSEDYHFCKEWREKCGGTVWAAPWAKLAHIGTHMFDGILTPQPEQYLQQQAPQGTPV